MKKLSYLDFVKGLCMLLIVFGHFIPDADHPVAVYVYSFHVPAFFIVSGILIEHTKEYNRGLFHLVKHNTLRLIVPYICFEMINNLRYCVMHGFSNMGWLTWQMMILYDSGFATWFLPVLFVSKAYVLLVKKYLKKEWAMAIACVIPFCITQFSGFSYHTGSWKLYLIFRSCNAIGFLWIGMMLYRWLDIMIANKRIFACCCSISLVCGLLNGRVSAFGLEYGCSLLYVTAAVAGTVMLLYIGNHVQDAKPIYFFSMNSIVVLGTHQVIKEIMKSIFGEQVLSAYWYVFLIAVLLMEFPLAHFINRYLPFFLGRWSKTKRTQVKKC